MKSMKLSYRKQIARQLRTQYVDGIYSNPVTLRSRLGRHSRSLKMAKFDRSHIGISISVLQYLWCYLVSFADIAS